MRNENCVHTRPDFTRCLPPNFSDHRPPGPKANGGWLRSRFRLGWLHMALPHLLLDLFSQKDLK